MKKVACALILILAASILSSCLSRTGQPVPSAPASTPEQTSPLISATQPLPENTFQQPAKDDIPAYLTIGLNKRAEMQPELERFYYMPYYLKLSLGPYFEQTDDYSRLAYFEKSTSVDLDGNGKEETITISGGKSYDKIADQDPSYYDITINIDGNELQLKDKKDLPFSLCGKILDFDKSDGKKEILIEASLILVGSTDYIITYDEKVPRTAFTGKLESAIGAGYIMTPEIFHTTRENLYFYELFKIKSDRSGFETADNQYYPTLHQQFCFDEYGNWSSGNAAPTQSGQYLYKEPGGKNEVWVDQGTPVFLGLYAKDGWIMILDANGELLGWLDTDKVDFEEYTNYAFVPEGD